MRIPARLSMTFGRAVAVAAARGLELLGAPVDRGPHVRIAGDVMRSAIATPARLRMTSGHAVAMAAACVLGLLGAPAEAAGAEERPLAVATISILADFVRAVAGDRLEVVSIVHVGGDPHTYEPVPSDARRIADADVVVRNGLGLERWLDRLIATGAKAQVVTATEGLDPLLQAHGEYRGHPDPHLWMDPRFADAYVRNIEAALSERYPSHAAEFAERARRYVERLEALDREIAGTLAGIERERRKLVTTHDAFRYFGRRYGVEVVATIWGISTEREPSAREIRAIVDGIRKHDVRVVFVETTVNPALMLRIAEETGIHVGAPLYGDSVGPPGSGADTYLGMMRANTRAVAEGLREGWET